MLKSKHHPILYPFFRWYCRVIVKRHFKTVYLIGDDFEDNKAILVLANHVSWWDGFWVAYMNELLFNKQFYFMMAEEQLKKYRFFNQVGGFSVKRGSRTIFESLGEVNMLLKDSRNMVLVFPQGQINSIYERNFKFEKGLRIVLSQQSPLVNILMTVNLIDYCSNKKPSLYCYRELYNGDLNILALEREYNSFYNRCLEVHKQSNKG